MEVSAGAGSRRLQVLVLTDDDDNPDTPAVPQLGALVHLTGTDAVSADGLLGTTTADGMVQFDRVSGPFGVSTMVEAVEPGTEFLPTQRRRVGAGLWTSAPAGQATLLMPPSTWPQPSFPTGTAYGDVLNLPAAGPEEFWGLVAVPVGAADRRDAQVERALHPPNFGWSANVEPGVPHWLLVKRIRQEAPSFVELTREVAWLGPFTVPDDGDFPQLVQDLDYATAQRFIFDVPLPLSHVDAQPLNSGWAVDVLAAGPDGRRARARVDQGSFSALPAQVLVVDPATAPSGWSFRLGVLRPLGTGGFLGQSCVVELPAPLPDPLVVDELFPATLFAPGDDQTYTVAALDPFVATYAPRDELPAHGFDLLRYSGLSVLPDEQVEVIFDLFGPPLRGDGLSSVMVEFPPTPLPMVVPSGFPSLLLRTVRSDAFPADHERLLDFGFEPELRAVIDGQWCDAEDGTTFVIADE
jgi:hypothetical protein